MADGRHLGNRFRLYLSAALSFASFSRVCSNPAIRPYLGEMVHSYQLPVNIVSL